MPPYVPPQVAVEEHYTVTVPPSAALKGATDSATATTKPWQHQESIELDHSVEPDRKVLSVQQQVDEAVILMRDNVNLALERDSKITDMETRAEQLSDASLRFKKTTRSVESAQWRANIKWTIALILAFLVLIGVVILIMRPWTW
jgi:hypothetical protein